MMNQVHVERIKRHSVRLHLIPVGVLSIFFLIEASHASTGTGWGKNSSWSPSDESHSAAKSLRTTEVLSRSISPFSPGSHNLSLDLGQVFLMGDLAQYSSSLGTQLHYNYGVSDLFSFDSSIGYSTHAENSYSMLNLLSGIRVNFSWYDKIIPYGVFGLGFYRPNYSDQRAAPGIDGSRPQYSSFLFGFHFGPGVNLEISKNMFFGASLTYHSMFGSTVRTSQGSTLNMGGSYTSFLMHIGTSF